MAESSGWRPFKGLILFAGIVLVVTLLYGFIMSAAIPPIKVPDRQQLIAELDNMATHFDWRPSISRSHAEHCQNLIEEGRTRTDTLTTFREEFTRLDDQIAILFALGRVYVTVGECRFREALNPQNSHVKQNYLSQGTGQLALAYQALEDAHQRVVYTLKAKRNRVYNLERTKRYIAENDVQTKLSVWQAYTECLLQYSGQHQSTPETLAVPKTLPTPDNLTLTMSDRILETCRETSVQGS